MPKRWRSLPFLILGLLVPSFAFASHSFENTAIVRTVELGGTLVHVTTTYAVKSLEAGSSVYTVALGQEQRQKTSWVEAKIKGQTKALRLEDLGYDEKSKSYLFGVDLSNPLNVGETASLVLETVETHATYPWPQSAGQEDEQQLRYNTSLFIISPYHTAVQRTKIKLPSARVISYTTPEDIDEFTLDNPVTKSGATVTYGPYHNIAASTNVDFIEKYQKLVTIHFNYDFPVLEVTQYKRAAEVSHWGANLNIQDDIYLHNGGPTLKGHFSRLVHQTQAFYQRSTPHVLSSMHLYLPAGISNVYYYDLIGNVSTSKLRTTPSVSRNVKSPQYSVLEMRPRYPLMGGWNYSFTLGWDSPLRDSANWDADNGRYIVGVPVMTQVPSAVINDAEVKVILPEGATDIEVYQPFSAIDSSMSTHTTYLDTTGRPAITFKYKNLTDKHNQVIYVAYKVSLSAHLKKPMAVATAFIILFSLAFGGRRVNLSLHKK